MAKKLLGVVGIAVLLLAASTVVNFYVLHPKARAAPDFRADASPETIERGRYLAQHVLGCVTCHSPIDEERPGDFIVEGGLLSGREFPVVPEMLPGKLVAPNLTPDRDTGLGAWTDGEIARAVREGVSRDGRPLFPMMNYGQYRLLTDEDTLAVVAYLRSVPPIRNALPPTPSTSLSRCSSVSLPRLFRARRRPGPMSLSPAEGSC